MRSVTTHEFYGDAIPGREVYPVAVFRISTASAPSTIAKLRYWKILVKRFGDGRVSREWGEGLLWKPYPASAAERMMCPIIQGQGGCM
jgi:hypothetical protein